MLLPRVAASMVASPAGTTSLPIPSPAMMAIEWERECVMSSTGYFTYGPLGVGFGDTGSQSACETAVARRSWDGLKVWDGLNAVPYSRFVVGDVLQGVPRCSATSVVSALMVGFGAAQS